MCPSDVIDEVTDGGAGGSASKVTVVDATDEVADSAVEFAAFTADSARSAPFSAATAACRPCARSGTRARPPAVHAIGAATGPATGPAPGPTAGAATTGPTADTIGISGAADLRAAAGRGLAGADGIAAPSPPPGLLCRPPDEPRGTSG